MTYHHIQKATFLKRPNRFIAHVLLQGKEEIVHVKNTGRCRELLEQGNVVYLEKGKNPNRKTAYDLVAVEKKRPEQKPLLVNMDSQAPNTVVEEWLQKKGYTYQREVKKGKSRFDFFVSKEGQTGYLEVKGCTLEEEGVARFPDAPTERGIKHVRELISLQKQGLQNAIIFVVQMEQMREFRPNEQTHLEFAKVLKEAKEAGVTLRALTCKVTPDTLEIAGEIPIKL